MVLDLSCECSSLRCITVGVEDGRLELHLRWVEWVVWWKGHLRFEAAAWIWVSSWLSGLQPGIVEGLPMARLSIGSSISQLQAHSADL